MIKIA